MDKPNLPEYDYTNTCLRCGWTNVYRTLIGPQAGYRPPLIRCPSCGERVTAWTPPTGPVQ